jgi:hypothetical protein
MSPTEIDALLGAQAAVAWAGVKGDTARLGWWKTELMTEFGGEDLFKRLLPHTWDWAVVQALREAARRHDGRMRGKVHDPDTVVSLYRMGFAVDERADERLLELKRSGVAPGMALPAFGELVAESFRRERFEGWVRGHGEAQYEAAPAGREIKGPVPSSLEETVKQLVAALVPLGAQYPLPHFRRGR